MHKHCLFILFVFFSSILSHADEETIYILPEEMEYTEESIDESIDDPSNEPIDESPEAIAKSAEDKAVQLETQNFLDCEPTTIVNRSVNVISGVYIDQETDLILPGAEPIQFNRSYASTNTFDGCIGIGWSLNYDETLYISKDWSFASLIDGYGSILKFERKEKLSRHTYNLLPDNYLRSVTNSGGGALSGRNNIKNTRLQLMRDDKHVLVLTNGAGEEKTYERFDKGERRLVSEKKSNGNQFAYLRSHSGKLRGIQTLNRDGKLLQEISLEVHRSKLSIRSPTQGLLATLILQEINDDEMYITEANPLHGPKITYTYEGKKQKAPVPRITKKEKPDNRYQEIQYYRHKDNLVGDKKSGFIPIFLKNKLDPAIGRVMFQRAPVGNDHKPWVTHRYVYENNWHRLEDGRIQGKAGKAHVYDAYDYKIKYFWNDQERLNEIHRHTGQGEGNYRLYSKERLFWGAVDSPFCTSLMARNLEDKDGNIQFIRYFNYDASGNVLNDKLLGNLSGANNLPCKISEAGVPETNGREVFEKVFTYKEGKRNLVGSMTEGDRREEFSYKGDTDLLTCKLYKYSGQIYKREFYEYDENAVLVKEWEDDGNTADRDNLSGVTERRIRVTIPTIEEPIGLPQVVEERYLDFATGEEKLFKKTVNTYSLKGFLDQRDIYDCNDAYVCSLYWEYDNMGNVIMETDPLGNVISRDFDPNGNKILEQGPNPDVHTEYVYDFSNRLIQVKEIHNDGPILVQSNEYNRLSNKVKSIDIYGNSTTYDYDDFSRVTKVSYPEVMDENGSIRRPEEHKAYDVLNHPVRRIDAKGNYTHFSNTIRGKPHLTTFADGSQEGTVYNYDGTVKTTTAKNKTVTKYTLDGAKRPIRKEIYSPSGELLNATSCTYNAFRITSETDAAGIVKKYVYNGAGQLIETTKGSCRNTYSYDSMGRLVKTIEHNGENDCTAKIQAYDLLDRVIEEYTEDADGNILTKAEYVYDEMGNRIQTITYNENGANVTRTKYNSRKQPVSITDAEGNVTTIAYKYDYRDEHGTFVPYSEMTDPMGNVICTIGDSHGRTSALLHKNHFGQITQKRKFYYDFNGNKCRQVETVFTPGAPDRQVVTSWSYDSMNRMTSLIEAVGTPEQKQTTIAYNSYGQKDTLIKPDGVQIKHEYDLLGRLKAFYSTDGTVRYTYEYDANSNLIRVFDHVKGMETRREYDKNDRLKKETLANGLAIDYAYDSVGRPLVITLPDGSGMEYVYRANQLKEVHRLSQEKQRLCSHSYLAFDLEGKQTLAQLVGNAGQAKYVYDVMGRTKSLLYNLWSETITSYDKAGNLLTREVSDSIGKQPCEYSYDDLYQVVSEKSSVLHSYTCDSLYNRVAKDDVGHTLNGLNQLLNDGRIKYSYDANGNLTKKCNAEGLSETVYKYDALDRLVKVKKSGQQQLCYTYDAQNRRLSKSCATWDEGTQSWRSGKTVRYLYVGQNEIGACDGEGKTIELRLLGLSKGAEIGGAVAVELCGRMYAPLHDHNGNVSALVDSETGGVVETYRYTAFGEEEIYDGLGERLSGSANPWRFSSKRVDEETSFVYFGRRYYEPCTGRWVTPDPIGYEGGPNLYAYVMNSPLTHFDLYGLVGAGEEAAGQGWFRGNTFWEQASNFMGSMLRMPGRIVEFAGRNLVPIPLARDIVEITGRLMSGRGLNTYEWSCRHHSSFDDLGLPELADNLRIVLNGGIWTSKSEMKRRAEIESEKRGGVNVHYYYNSTHGLVYDLMESACQLVGIPTATQESFNEYMRGMVEQVGGVNGGGRVELLSHSQGGIMTSNLKEKGGLSPDQCKKIHVATFGSAKFVNNDDFGSAVNYVSKRDSIPLVNHFNYLSARIKPRSDVIFLNSSEIPLTDHAWENKAYQKGLADYRGISPIRRG